MFTTTFWKGAVERAVKSAAQAVVLAVGGDAALDLWQVDVAAVTGIAAGAAVLSLLTSLASGAAGPKGSPSLVREEPHTDQRPML